MHAFPPRASGTLLDNNFFRIMDGLRLGIDICAHLCVCGTPVESKGSHDLKCKKVVDGGQDTQTYLEKMGIE